MKNLQARLAKLERSFKATVPLSDWTQTAAYAALSEVERQRINGYTDRFNKAGLSSFSDEELDDYEALLLPFVKEDREKDNGR